MSYKCEILADSLSPQGERLTTMKITFPRIVLAEFNTHRMFSRNSASSRAIPFNKMVKMVEENPFIPIAWQRDHRGMQGTEYLEGDSEKQLLINKWLEARDLAVQQASLLQSNYVTKQLCNRLLEPFMWHTVIITSGKEGLDNFFNLRCPRIYHAATNKHYKSLKDWNNVDKEIQWIGISCLHPENKSQAEIHIQAIAELMWDAYNESTPKQLQSGEWHMPFINDIVDTEIDKELDKLIKVPSSVIIENRLKISVARCARISYTTLGDNPKIDYEADIKLHDMLAESGHWSPFEHVARAMSNEEYYSLVRGQVDSNIDVDGFINIEGHTNLNIFGWCRNFRGFIQYRELIDK